MKQKKLSLIKRIFVLFCCTALLSSSIFMSYSQVLYAEEVTKDDLFDSFLAIAIAVVGAIVDPPVGIPALALLFYDVASASYTIGEYIYENSDGTYTIDEQFIQAALQAAEELEARGFTDKDIINQKKGSYDLHYVVVDESNICGHCYQNVSIKYEGLIFMNGLSCCKVVPDSSGLNNLFVFYADHSTQLVDYQRAKCSCGYSYNTEVAYGHSYGANVPIFTDSEDVRNYLSIGTGYKNALNYRTAPLFRKHSSYTPTYSGGAVTVNRTVVNNIISKITEVDADDSLSDDQKIEILQQYIFSGGNQTPTPTPTPSDPDYDDNKDLPAGEDLSDTNSWLKKIYLKVCQIYAKMNAAVEDAEDAAIAKIQESLDEIIEQLKKIKRWTIVDTVIDGVDAIADWLDLIRGVISDAENGVGSAVTTVAESLADSTDSLSTKFPFSIPWDILFFISALAADPQVPYFEIPMDIEMEWLDINIHYDFVIDFSQFQWFSNLSRLILSMTYAVGLLKLTMNIAMLKKEE